MTISELLQRIETTSGRLSRRFSDPLLAVTEEDHTSVVSYLLSSQRAITDLRGWFTATVNITTEQGKPDYYVPQGRIDRARIGTGQLRKVAFREVEHIENEGTPDSYARFQDRIWLAPVPNRAHEVKVILHSTELIAEDESAEHGYELADWLSDPLYRAMELYAMGQWLEDNGHELADRYHQRFMAQVRSLRPIEQKQKKATRPYTPY